MAHVALPPAAGNREGIAMTPSIGTQLQSFSRRTCSRIQPRPWETAARTLALVVMALLSIGSAQADTARTAEAGPASEPTRPLAYVALRNAAAVLALDIDSGETVARIPVGPLPLGTTASRDGTRVAVVTRERTAVELIDTRTQTVIGQWLFRDLLRTAYEAKLSTAGLSDPTEGQIVSVLSRYTIGSVILSGRGDTLFVIGREGTILRFDVASGKADMFGFQLGISPEFQALFGPSLHIFDAVGRLSADDRRLFVPDANRNGMMILDAEKLEVIGELPGLIYGNFDLARDDSLLAMLAFHFDVADLSAFTVRRVGRADYNPTHGGFAGATSSAHWPVALSPDAHILYAPRNDALGRGSATKPTMVVALDTRSGKRLAMRHIGDQPTDGLAVSPDGRRVVVVAPASNAVHVLDAQSLAPIRVIEVGPTPQAGVHFVVSAGK